MNRQTAKLVTDAALTVADSYPMFMSDRGKESFDILRNGLANKEIYNVDFKEANFRLSNAFEKAEDRVKRIWNDEGAKEALYYISHTLSSINSLPKLIREYEKWIKKPEFDPRYNVPPISGAMKMAAQDMLDLYKSWLPLRTLKKDLKPFIVKGRKPSGKPVKPKYVPPPSSRGSLQRVEAMLKDLIESRKGELEKSILGQMIHVAEYFLNTIQKSSPGTTPRSYYRGSEYGGLLDQVLEPVDGIRSREWKKGAQWKKDGKKTLAKIAKRNADDIATVFVSKNMRKLTSIIAEKEQRSGAKLTEQKEVKTTFHNGVFEGWLYFAFSDGTNFHVKNQMVTKYSPRGKFFAQYPTTFHKVEFPDGKKKAKQSEKQMNEDWIGA